NAAMDHATVYWIFWMDADDRFDEANRHKLSELFAGLPGEMLAYTVKCLCPARSDSDAATAVDHVRLFPRHPQLRWEYRVHEQILPALRRLGGRVSFTDVVVEHTGYLDAALRRRKLERDLWLLHLENAEKPDEPFVLFNLGTVYQELGQVREALSMFQRSLARSQTVDAIVRKLHAMIAQCHPTWGKHAQALPP